MLQQKVETPNIPQYGHEESNKSVEDGDGTFTGW